jgi:hypothetical protein
MSETTTPKPAPKPAPKGGVDNGYPFLSKARCKAQILENDEFCLQALQIMHERTARREPGSKGLGWMASHENKGEALAVAAKEDDLDEEQVAQARGLLKSYSKQVAFELREGRLASEPDLATSTEAFFRPNS